jgi:RNA polymerase sigma-70 factor (ECF subfamily)
MLQAPATRATLLVRLRDAGDEDAWRQFLELYGPVVYRLYRHRGLQDADAADLTQEVLRAVAAGAGQLDYDPERGTFRGWLYGVVRNKLRDFLSRRCRQPQATGDAATLGILQAIPAADDESDQWEREYQRRLFAVAADKVRTVVDDATWQAFWRTAVDGQPARDVAEALRMSVGAVYVAKSRVVARMKQQVAEIEGNQT